MDRSRWISLVVAITYLVVFILIPLSAGEMGGDTSGENTSTAQAVGGLLLFLGFVCVWWSETLGAALWVGHGAWNPQPSSSGAMKILGWIFLISAFGIHLWL
jgi:hypothetical protein